MSNAKATDNNKHDDTKHEDNKESDAKDSKDNKESDAKDSKDDKESDAKDDESVSLVETATTTAKEVAGLMVDKMADGMAFAAEKIKEARK